MHALGRGGAPPPRSLYQSRPDGATRRSNPRLADSRAPMASVDEMTPSPSQAYKPPPRGVVLNSPSLDRSMPLASDAKYPTNQALITDTLGPSPQKEPAPSVRKVPHSASTGSLNKRSQGMSTTTSRTSPVTIGPGYYPPGPPGPGHPGPGPASKAPRGGPGSKYKESGYSSSSSSSTRPPPVEGVSIATRSLKPQPQPYVVDSRGRAVPQPGPRQVVTLPASGGPRPMPLGRQPTPPYAAGENVVNPHPGGGGPSDFGDVSNVPGAVRRPMSFVKALEMSDQIALKEQTKAQRQQIGSSLRGNTPDESSEQKLYGSSYEISV